MSANPKQFKRMAAVLEASGQYRVLRRSTQRPPSEPPADVPTRLGLLLDLETTGLDPLQHAIIEFAMLPFTYGLDGTVYTVGEPFSRLRQPAQPIPPAITALTGLTTALALLATAREVGLIRFSYQLPDAKRVGILCGVEPIAAVFPQPHRGGAEVAHQCRGQEP